MPVLVHVPTYRLRLDVLQSFLERIFPSVTIKVSHGDDAYIAMLPRQLTRSEWGGIDDLRAMRRGFDRDDEYPASPVLDITTRTKMEQPRSSSHDPIRGDDQRTQILRPSSPNICHLDTSWFDRTVGENDQVLISHKKEIYRGWKSRVYVVKLHASGNGLAKKGPNGKPIQDTFTLKEYGGAAKEDYMNELRYFQLLKNLPGEKSENIVKFYCSFRELGPPVKYNIILEYADGGSLVDLFQQDNPPVITSELVQFWGNLVKLADGLDTVHRAKGHHGDIKPSNILIFRKPGSKFGSTFKLADFGTSASQMYSSPENYRYSIADKRIPKTSSASGDVWSLGCVFSEILIWSMMGESGRQEYRQSRLSETNNTPLKGSGYDGCFHNGTGVLGAVERMHSLVLTTSRRLDSITHPMSQFILESIFSGRASSRDIYENTRDIVQRAKEMLRVRPQQNPKLDRPPRVLSLDGGGLRGLSSLFILRRILMEATGSQETKPCEYFDMIAGSGTGGLIAILLGRLCLSINDCIDTYSIFARLAFVQLQSSKQKSSALFSSRNIDQALKRVLAKHGLSDYELLRKPGNAQCKVFVCAMDDIVLRSYDTPSSSQRSAPLFDCLIREAARATVAVPSLFDPVTIGGSQFMSGGRSTGGGLGIDNPINTVWQETKNVWGLDNLPIIISIGATQPYSDAALGMMAHKTLGRATADIIDAIASNAEFTASQFARNRRDYVVKGFYFRFNPKTDLVFEWIDVPSLEAQTVAHLESSVDSEYFEMCTRTLRHGQPNVHPRDIQVLLSMSEATSSQLSSSAWTHRSSIFTDSANTELASVSSIDETNEERLVHFLGTHLLEVPGPIGEMVPQVFLRVVSDLLMRYSDALAKLAKSSEEREVVRFISRNCEPVARDLWEWIEIHSPMKSSSTEQLGRIGPLPLAGTHRAISVTEFAQRFGSSLKISQPGVDEGNISPPSVDRTRSFLETDTVMQELTQLFEYWVNSDLLHLAIYDNNITDVKALLESGFPVEKVDCKGVDALSFAVENINLPITKVLLRYMAKNAATPSSEKLQALKAISNAALPKYMSNEKLLEAAEIRILLSEEDGNPGQSVLRAGFSDMILMPPGVPVVSFEWTLPYVVRQDIGDSLTPSEVLSKVVVLTGSKTRYRCTTCSEFISSEWGPEGSLALSLIGRALNELFGSIGKVDEEDTDNISHTTQADPRFNLVVKISMGRISILQLWTGHRKSVLEVLQWLASAVRSDAPNVVKSASSIHRISLPGGDGLPLLSVRLNPFEPLQNLDVGDSGCWVEMFRTGVVAIRDLPGAQGWGQGLEIDFGLMVHISAVGVSQMLADADGKPLGYVLAGFRTVLVPVSRRGQAIQWHFESSVNGDPGKFEAIDPYESHPVKTNQWLKVQGPAEFRNLKCYVGWSERALILLGTENRQEQFDLSQSKSLKRVIELGGIQVNAQTNFGAISPLPLNVAVAGQYIFRSTTQQFEPSQEYLAALNQTLPQVALVLDTDSQQAWLVPGLSLHLHMCHRYFSEYKGIYQARENPIPYAERSVHGHEAAFKVLHSHFNTTVFQTGNNMSPGQPGVIAMWQIFMIANKNLAKSQETSLESKGHRLRGAELQNMVLPPASMKSHLREVEDRKMDPWLPLSNLADVVLVCRNIGLAIQPEEPLACDCGSLPRGKYYLAAHTWCLATILYNQRIIESRDKLGNSDHQIGGFRWAPSRNWAPRADCPHHGDGASIWKHPEKVLQTMIKKGKSLKRKQLKENGVEQDSTCIPDTGVLVFGLSK